MINFHVVKTGEYVLIHDEMPISEIEYLVSNRYVASKRTRRAWEELDRIVKERGYRNLLSYKKLVDQGGALRRMLTLPEFRKEVSAMREASDSKKYSHPVEWFLQHWKPDKRHAVSLSNPRETLSLFELVEFLKRVPPEELKKQNKERYRTVEMWVRDNFRLTLADFHRYFVIHNVPAFKHLLRSLIDGQDQE